MSLFTVTPLDLYTLFGLMAYVIIVLFVAEFLCRKNIITGKFSRKMIHILVGNVVLVFPFGFTNRYIALIGPAFFIIFTYLTCPKSPIKKLRLKGVEEGHAFGTVYYTISLAALTAIFFYPDITNQKNIILFASFLPLVWGDGLSAIFWQKEHQNKTDYYVFGSERSFLGSWIMAFASATAVFIGIIIYKIPVLTSFYLAMLCGATSAIVEALSPKGTDNLTVPLINAAILYGLYCYLNENFLLLEYSINWKSLIAALILAVILAVGGVLSKALTVDGALAGLFFGLVILGLGSWTFGAIYGTFFVIGSFFTIVGKRRKLSITKEFEKGSTARDSVQATVNSIVPAVLTLAYVVFHQPSLTVAISASLATSLADTLGTELGIMFDGPTVISIKPWKKVDKGYPGAISAIGTIGTLFGAGTIAFVGWIVSLFDNFIIVDNNRLLCYFVPVLIGGFLGAYMDSVLAVTIQRINKCPKCGKITEKKNHCDVLTVYYHGVKWLKNDGINLFSIISGALIGIMSYALICLL